jgi:hypothetical protein
MDVDRCRKTVIAGTFAIARKSLSNANPISSVGLRCTSMLSMKLPSMIASSTRKAFTRAMPKHLQHSLIHLGARHARSDGRSDGVGVEVGYPTTRGRGENSRVGRVARIPRTRLTPEMAGPIFNFSAEIFRSSR